MTDATQGTWNDWIGADVCDNDGDKIGSLQNVYMDRASGEPEWLLVKTGMMGKSSFVPIAGAGADDDMLRVPYGKDLVKDAPNVDDEDGYLPPEDEEQLYRHYGREDYKEWDDANDVDITAGREDVDVDVDKSRSSGDDAMTLSEEQLKVGTEQRETGRARLRKYVVTENVTTTVPVRKEKVRLEREPITDANRDKAMDGADITEAEHEVILHEEQPVVGKETVAKERVSLEKDTVVENQSVSGEVRKEEIEVDDDTNTLADDDKKQGKN